MSFKPYKFNPIEELGLDIPRNKRREALDAAAEYVKEAMLDYIGEGKSPVAGGKWVRGLTKEYKERKGEESSATFANLELSGEMLDSLDVEATSRHILVDLDEEQYGKAEGHITGVYGEHSKETRPRQFMPQPGQSFNRTIMQNIKKILEDYEE